MNILTLFLTVSYLLVVTECCMRMVPPDDAYIPSTLSPEQSTMAPGEITLAPEQSTVTPEEGTMAPEDTTMAPGGVSTPETSEETEAPEVTMMTTIAMESSTVTEETCPTFTTKCPDLSALLRDGMMVQVVDGCAVFSCPEDLFPYALGSIEESEITGLSIPAGVTNYVVRGPYEIEELGGGTVNDYYGLSCENNKLIASIYPRGIAVGFTTAGADGSLNGKKTPVDAMLW
ncbi:DUF281 domain-containing protein [Caenorhabditis elegans]|uniref:DUF281 domain-containing protein n=1 Tax=Caenorhabditis elegans TaxID=6239 RepID=O76597_CAEEL|nr:DUF281 domain-containing protein [Caenorhabditis elegans]CCD69606.1 DUF281 domain-containing protein [Caenorhabditis elegans]|eukprot:NP_494266.1 Uncharacterized protein CELE_F16G10.13 [Caenorhabditis elegans]